MLIGVYGASGFGREVMPIARATAAVNDGRAVFIDDGDTLSIQDREPTLTFDQFLAEPDLEKAVSVAIADTAVRQKLEGKCLGAGIKLISLAAANHVRGDGCELGEGSILCAFTCLTADCKIGRSFQCNIYSYVAHDCVIGDYVTFAPGVCCNGNVHVEDEAYIGTGAILRQGTPDKPLIIGRGAVVGAGAVVTKNVEAGTTVIGSPAKPLVRK